MGRKKSETSKLDVQGKANSPFAKRLSGLIAEKDNGKELERFLGVSPQAINQYKNGESRPSLDNICKIADFYHVSVDYLLGRTEIKSADYHISSAVEITGLSEEDIVALALANRISQSYIPSQPAKEIWPVESYNPPADVSMTYQKFVHETKLLQFICPVSQEYYNNSRVFDEMALDLLRHLPSCIDDLIHAVIQDWSIVSEYRTLCKSPYIRKPDVEHLSKEHQFAVENGYALMETGEYFDYLTQKIGRSIAGYLSAKLNSTASNLDNAKNSTD